ncbi:unnamed protein product [Brachionus calyciflorus]|uniref:Uncharacterized protein n=1 Tax=Brachionus calyciflorus TaxID=104777 RepID=A0A813ZRS1_9BILA|nr:unnamed protein product [Brachionus calyciflorus]
MLQLRTTKIPVFVNNHRHEVDNGQKASQIRALERREVAKYVIANYGGSSTAYLNFLASEGIFHLHAGLPIYFIQRIKPKKVEKKSNDLNGYDQQIEIFNNFNLTMHHENQLKLIKNVPEERRILHIDATGGLIKIKNGSQVYGQILNYCMILKDSSRLDYPECHTLQFMPS